MSDPRSQRAHTLLGAVLGSYRITGVLGTGGMGAVFRARHEILDREVAVKVLRTELTANEELVQRFLTEARAATQIRHPGIIEVFDFGYTEDARAYLVMELLEGQPLSDRIKSRTRLAEREMIEIARGIASALSAAHAGGVVHRDLKPDNVYLVPDRTMPSGERPKVLDFGIAKLLDAPDLNHTQTGALMGTPLYMAPEQARAARMIDHRADLYSLGCMCYEMLAGEPPFVAEGAGEIIAMQMFSTAVPLRERLAITPELEQIVMRLLEKEPDARYQHAGEVVDALGAITPRASGQFGSFMSEGAPRPPVVMATQQPFGNQPAPSLAGLGSNLSLRDAAPPPVVEKRTAMPIIAGLVTVGLAIVVGVLVLGRDGGADGPDGDRKDAKATVPIDAGAPVLPSTPAKPDKPVVVDRTPAPRDTAKPVEPRPTRPIRPTRVTAPIKETPASTGPTLRPEGIKTNDGSPIFESLDDKPTTRPTPEPAKPPEAPDPAPTP